MTTTVLPPEYQFSADTPASKEKTVEETPEFFRVFNLPRRVWDLSIVENSLLDRITAAFRLPTGQQVLRPIQGAALADGHDMRGLLGPIRVGDGKCTEGATEVFDGRLRRTVAELVGKHFCVLSKNTGNKITYEKATAALSGRKKCVRLTLADGSSVGLSVDHPVFTPKGWTQAGLLCLSDLVATPRSVPEPKETLGISDDEVVLAAYLLSDGGVSQQHTSFTNITPVILREMSCVAEKLAVDRQGRIGRKNVLRQGSRQADFRVLGMRHFREKWGLHGLAKEKRLPAEFWSMSKRQVALFLNRFWACDGYVDNQGVGITLASEKMIDDLKFLLLRLGIRSSKRYREACCQTGVFDAWRLSIRGSEALKFFDSVGYIFGKEHASKKKEFFLRSKRRNTNYDVVPISRKEMYEIYDELGFTRRGGDPSVRTGGRSAATSFVGATDGQYISLVLNFEDFCEKYRYTGKYAWLAKSELTWEKVQNIEDVGVRDVYDLSVPKTECFVGNNIVLHNTHLSFLFPVVLQGIYRPTLLLPAGLVEKTWNEFQVLKLHWLCHPSWATRSRFDEAVITYEQLGRDSGKEALMARMPDIVLADEVHFLRNRNAARTKRVERFFRAFPHCLFVGMSGTITKRSIRDYWHLLEWALKDKMPLPRSETEMEIWAEALDERKIDVLSRRDPGALMKLCTDEERDKVKPKRTAPLGRTDQMPAFFSNLEEKLVLARQGYQRRLRDTPGVVCSPDANLDCSLRIRRVSFELSPTIQDHLDELRENWLTPNGDLLALPTDVWRHARELACGFYYRWVPPPPAEWLAARRRWNWLVRDILIPPQVRSKRDLRREMGQVPDGVLYEKFKHLHLDSPFQVANAVVQKRIEEPNIVFAYNEWNRVKNSYKINVVADWLSEDTLKFCAQWAEKNGDAILWTEHRAFGGALAKWLNTGYCSNGGLDEQGRSIESYNGKLVVASVAANKEGRNLQAWNKNFVITAPPTGSLWEQLIGRTHRPGQLADTVYVDWLCACAEQDEGFSQLMADARYIQHTTGQSQKLLYADHVVAPMIQRSNKGWKVEGELSNKKSATPS